MRRSCRMVKGGREVDAGPSHRRVDSAVSMLDVMYHVVVDGDHLALRRPLARSTPLVAPDSNAFRAGSLVLHFERSGDVAPAFTVEAGRVRDSVSWGPGSDCGPSRHWIGKALRIDNSSEIKYCPSVRENFVSCVDSSGVAHVDNWS